MARILLVIILALISACSKQGGQTNAKLEITSSFLLSGQPGGTMLYLINKDEDTQQAIGVDSNQTQVTLANGNWDFVVLSWSGTNTLQGTLRCAKTSANLVGGEANVSLSLSTAACNDNFFSPAAFRASSSTNALQLHSCRSIATATANGVCDAVERGTANSYKVKLLSHKEVTAQGEYNESILGNTHVTSNCYQATSVDNGMTALPNIIPFGSSSFRPAVAIEAYSTNNCDGEGRGYYFPHGLASNLNLDSDAKVFSYENKANIYLDNGKLQISQPGNFGNYVVGGSPSSTSVTVSNYSSITTTITSITATGDFSVNSGSCPINAPLNPGIECSVTVIFSPTTIGLREGLLTVTYNDGQSQSESVSLSGNGLSQLAANAGNGEVNVVWGAVTGATSYRIYRSEVSNIFSAPFIAEVTTSPFSFTDSSVTNNIQYYYQVRAFNGTTEFSSTPQAAALPIAAPSGLGFNIYVNGAISLYWDPVAGATSYDIRYGTITGEYTNTIQNATSPFNINNLSDNTDYYFSVRARNNVGTGASVDSSEASQISSPASPPNISVSTLDGVNTLSWTPVSGVQGYHIYRSSTSNNFITSYAYVSGQASSSWADNASSPGTTWYYTVRAYNGVMSQINSEVSTKAIGIIPTPTVSSVQSQSMIVSWSSVSGGDNHELCVGFSMGQCTISYPLTSSPYTLNGLNPNTVYHLKIRASNTVGGNNIQESGGINQKTAMPAPSTLSAIAGQGQVQLNWSGVAGASNYTIYRGTSPGIYDTTVASNITALTYTNIGLTNGMTYYYVVRANNGVESANSPEASGRPMSLPATPTVGASTYNSIVVNWAAVAGANNYQVLYSTIPGNYTASSMTGNVTSFTVSYLSPGTNYYFKIRALNNIGTGASVESASYVIATTLTPAQLTINLGYIQFNNVLVGTTQSVSVTLSNPSATAAANINLSFFGDDTNRFSVTLGTCTSTLAANSSCVFSVNFTPLLSGTINAGFSYEYYNGYQNLSPSVSVSANNSIATGSMGAYYNNTSNWNTYVSSNTTFGSPSASLCDPATDTDCQHAGEVRKTVLPAEFSSCSTLTGMDSLQVFNWECSLESGSIVFRSKGLQKGKGLKDLVNSNSWKNIQFFAKVSSTTVYQTPLTTWWNNPLFNIDYLTGWSIGTTTGPTTSGLARIPMTGALQGFELNTSGAIYIISNNISVASLSIGASNVSLVSLPITGGVATLSTSNILTATCNSSSGTLSSPDTMALVCVGGSGANHSWIEVKANGINATGGVAILSVAPAFSRIHMTDITSSANGIHIKSGTLPNKIINSKVTNVTGTGLKVESDKVSVFESSFSGNNIGVHFNNASGSTLGGSKVLFNATQGLKIENSGYTRVHNSLFAFNQAQGVQYGTNSGTGHKFHDNLLSSNCTAAGNTGLGALDIGPATESFFFNFLSVHNNCFGVRQEMASSINHRNTFRNASVISNYEGIYVANSSYNTFLDIIAANNAGHASSRNWFLSSSYYNNLINVTATNAPYGIEFYNSNYNEFKNALLLGATSAECALTSSTVYFPTTYSSSSCLSAITNSGVSLDSSFVGRSPEDTMNGNYTSLASNSGSILFSVVTDFANFSNPFRYWGRNENISNTPFSNDNNYMCASTFKCTIWDWRLKLNDTIVKNRAGDGDNANPNFVASSACPSITDGADYTSTQNVTSIKFLTHALEINFDGTGNDNGLCESNEACVYSPNFGYYQGEGNLTGSCNFTGGVNSGDLSGIILKAFSTNGI